MKKGDFVQLKEGAEVIDRLKMYGGRQLRAGMRGEVIATRDDAALVKFRGYAPRVSVRREDLEGVAEA